jgi:hypothetical protein
MSVLRLRPFHALFAFLLTLAACGDPTVTAKYTAKREFMHSPELMKQVYSDATVVSRSPSLIFGQHGTQVEYHAPNGKTYLWYPGNSKIVVGDWEIRPSQHKSPELCYRYGTDTYNPVTRTDGGNWRCGDIRYSDMDILRGNPFRLRPGDVPRRIENRFRYFAEDYAEGLGIDVATLDFVFLVKSVEWHEKALKRQQRAMFGDVSLWTGPFGAGQ